MLLLSRTEMVSGSMYVVVTYVGTQSEMLVLSHLFLRGLFFSHQSKCTLCVTQGKNGARVLEKESEGRLKDIFPT